MNVRFLSILLAVVFFFIVIDLIRREKLTFKYAAGWLSVTFLGIILAVFDKFLSGFATKLGFELTSNFIFFTVSCGLIFLSLVLTIFLCQQNNRNDRMAQKIGLLENEIQKIQKEE
ncbi:MAG: DUF2304 domain-containing protein [Candidatus Omnitrophica bacterium]|nr:DUF2304 domain-containing protein [Candidatus Omnitrophota bacterium]